MSASLKYDVEDSNIALSGSDLERRVREHAEAKESAWAKAGVEPGLQIWRIEKFSVVDYSDLMAFPKKYGTFYDGHSYIVLHTYKPDAKAPTLRYDLHFWLGEHTTRDDAATAAYKTAELGDHLGGKATQYREIQYHESPRLKSYFPLFMTLHGDAKKMYTMGTTRGKLIVREVPMEGLVMRQGVVYVLDKGPLYWQFNTKKSTAWTRYKSAEYMMYLGQWRVPQSAFQVFDEGTADQDDFLQAAGITAPVMDVPLPPDKGTPIDPPVLHQLLGDINGWQLATVAAQSSSLQPDGVYILDDHACPTFPAVYTWLGKNVPEPRRKLALQYAQNYLHEKRTKEGERIQVATTIVKVNQETEPASFLEAFNPRTLS
ncbi:uncharacterized protein EDB91DRAFT_1236953 [Suillus paluster]|uniref:uncharacterized protein n=1 Tax=Suillus paluster TaxID=48578 RepID=UPI001B87DE13|nr:uncharacterized protein EDB91DRAFT_1236953 [Suillus paluster]KAG1742299.1 hypothetical protein EDB91DRAFT_1236953 [Suillus paluster]